ncbi:MAG: hypothetical protein LBV04_08110 [Deferribacteraceae bacterium]|jgi:hypothetical protein|nr:hypothetical protein [Deferribacteraceae bacterium]
MKRYIIYLLSFTLLTACAAREHTFYFDSNVDSVLISSEDQSCTAPCQLRLKPSALVYFEDLTYFRESDIHMHAYGSDGYIFDERERFEYLDDWRPINPHINSSSGAYWMVGFYAPLTLPFVSTTSTANIALTPSTTTADLAANAIEAMTVIHYDIDSYYIYVSDTASYVLDPTALQYVQYVLTNYEPMQAEIFTTEQPFIAAFAELIAKPTELIMNLLLASDNATSFLELLIEELDVDAKLMEQQ